MHVMGTTNIKRADTTVACVVHCYTTVGATAPCSTLLPIQPLDSRRCCGGVVGSRQRLTSSCPCACVCVRRKERDRTTVAGRPAGATAAEHQARIRRMMQ